MVLYYYDDPDDVNTLKGALNLGSITSITEAVKSNEICYELVGQTTEGSDATWDIRFVEEDAEKVVEM